MNIFPVKNKMRFAFWAAEEIGLLGSDQYVAKLTAAQRDRIRLYLNFDMIASPNYAIKVYDGDDSDATGAPAGPPGSAQIEQQLNRFFDSRNTGHVGTDFDGRSDYGPFIAAGIPAGGIFTGAEGIKTPANKPCSAVQQASPTTPATTRPATRSPTSTSRPWTSTPTPSPTPQPATPSTPQQSLSARPGPPPLTNQPKGAVPKRTHAHRPPRSGGW